MPNKRNKDPIIEKANLTETLDAITSEIDLFSEKLKACSNTIISEKKDNNTTELIYQRKEDYNTFLNEKLKTYKVTKDIQPATVFFIRSVIESLCNTSLTEREVKNKVSDICKDLGIKTTGRGNIVGSPVDVHMACSILCALGFIEADISPTTLHHTNPSIDYLRLHSKLPVFNKSPVGNEENGHNNEVDMKINDEHLSSSSSSSSSSSANYINGDNNNEFSTVDNDVALKGDEYIDIELGLLPKGEGANLVCSLTENYRGLLSKYFDDCREQKKKIQETVVIDTAADANIPLKDINDNNNNIDNGENENEDIDNSANDILLNEKRLSIETAFQSDDYIPNIETLSNDAILHISDQQIGEQELDLLEPLQSNDLEQTDSLSPIGGGVENQKSSIKGRKRNLQVSSEIVKVELENGQIDDSVVTIKRRSSNQRAWKLDNNIISSIASNPDVVIKNWNNACYEESLALEEEEALIRRIAGQCGIAIAEAPFRLGTRYLNPQMAEQQQVDLDYESKSNNMGPQTFREGAVYTASMLIERAKKNKKGKKGFKNSNNHDATIDDATLIPRIPKKSDLMRFPAPLCLRQDYYTGLQHHIEGSLYASVNKETVLTANIIMPDLLIRTTDIPWKLVANEFASLDNDSFESMVPIAQTPRNSDRLTANRVLSHRSSTDSFFSENNSIFKKATEVYAPTFRSVRPLSEFQQSDDNDDETVEDISDETVLQRHENGLQNMRDHWAKIKQLKRELKELNATGTYKFDPDNPDAVPTVGRKRSRNSNKVKKINSNTCSSSSSPRRRGRPKKKVRNSNEEDDSKKDENSNDQDDIQDDNSSDEDFQQ